jgi:4-hydroxy-tetrahydrodipicolinate synthase
MERRVSDKRYKGVFPVAPTVFSEAGAIDMEGQLRCIDFLIDAGSNGICILANWSEQFLLTDSERDALMERILAHVAGRVPVVVTTTHTASSVCAERCRRAQAVGAAMVMVMPPYHGATLRVGEAQVLEFFKRVSADLSIPVVIQDAPMAGTPLSAAFLAHMAKEIPNMRYFKIEVPQAAAKIRELLRLGGDAIEGPWDGEEGVTLYPDMEAGATGTMTGGGYPDGFRAIMDAYRTGDRATAAALYNRWLPLINYENRQCGLQAAKILMEEGGVIRSGAVRHPLVPVDAATRAGLIETARKLDPLVLRWAG